MIDLPAQVRSAWGAVQTADSVQSISGGLSNSRVWKIQSGPAAFALKASPAASMRSERIEQLHSFQKLLSQSCSFVPQLQLTRSGQSFVQADNKIWELSSWLAGSPVDVDWATHEHGQAAMMALAELHQISQSHSNCQLPIPAIADRVELIHRYRRNSLQLYQSVNEFVSFGADPTIPQLARETLHSFDQAYPKLLNELMQLQQPAKLCFVLRDIHREHMLFSGIRVSGVIDFGAARMDHPIVDLVRWLGTVYPTDVTMRHDLFKLYGQLVSRPVDLRLFQTLDHASTLLSAMQWLQWLVVDPKQFATPMQILLSRWGLLSQRLQLNQW